MDDTANKVAIFSPENYGYDPITIRGVEEAVLGAAIMEKGALDETKGLLHEHSFSIKAHQKIFKAIRQIQQQHGLA
jgi:replicative DNA helicase